MAGEDAHLTTCAGKDYLISDTIKHTFVGRENS